MLFGPADKTNPKLLVVELWGVGDLAIGTPFLQAASRRFTVTLLAKPHALELQPRFWPEVKVVTIVAPWTQFRGKYRLLTWPWRSLFTLRQEMRRAEFDCAVSARWDPREHVLLFVSGARERLGFPRLGSQAFLTRPQPLPPALAHRRESWQRLGEALGLDMPKIGKSPDRKAGRRTILIHSGAAQPVRVWPLERFLGVARKLRERHYDVHIVCDPGQRDWWMEHGERDIATPKNLTDLLMLLDTGVGFIGNDSGPGHLAAISGLPTFTIFGPQVPEWFAPLHPSSEWIEGKPCPWKPCFDDCRFAAPACILGLSESEVWPRIEAFAKRCLEAGAD